MLPTVTHRVSLRPDEKVPDLALQQPQGILEHGSVESGDSLNSGRSSTVMARDSASEGGPEKASSHQWEGEMRGNISSDSESDGEVELTLFPA